jgi:outer membrane protein
MKVFAVVPAVSLLLTAAPSVAQTSPAPRPAGQAAPARPQNQTPAAPKQPDPPPAAAIAPPAPPVVVPFRTGAKMAYVNINAIAQQSAEGKNAGVQINQFRDARQKELEAKQKVLEAKQARLAAGGTVRSDAARAQLQTEIDRDGKDLQRLAQDADEDLDRMTNQLQQAFVDKMRPVLVKVAKEKGVDFLFTDQSGIAWAADDLNLTADVIRELDQNPPAPAAAAPAAAPPAAPRTTPAAPAATPKPAGPATGR